MKSQCLFGDYSYCPPGFVDQDDAEGQIYGDWRKDTEGFTGLVTAGQLGSNNYSKTAKDICDDFMAYFNSPEGMVDWQWDYVNS